MSFLEKFKGKTQLLKKDEVGEILGQKSPKQGDKPGKKQMHLLKLTEVSGEENNSLTSSTVIKKKVINNNSEILKRSKIKQSSKDGSQSRKKIIQNPFLIQNEFFLDEEQHQAVLKKRKEDEIKERIEKQRKKRQQIKQQMMKSMKNSPVSQKYKKKQWVKLGGLGPNTGGEEWTKKKTLQQKMLKFAEEIKKINSNKFQHTKSLNLRENKSMTDRLSEKQTDARTMGIKYSKSIQKPTFYTLERTRYNQYQRRAQISEPLTLLPHLIMQQSIKLASAQDPQHNQFSNLKIQRNYSQLEKLEGKHKQFKNLIYQNDF